MLLISLVDLCFLVLSKNNICIVRSLVTNMPSMYRDYSMPLGKVQKLWQSRPGVVEVNMRCESPWNHFMVYISGICVACHEAASIEGLQAKLQKLSSGPGAYRVEVLIVGPKTEDSVLTVFPWEI